jgi:hypothetical protein
MKNPHRTSEGAGNHSGAAAGNIIAHLTCTRCHESVIPLVYPSGPHLRADCPNCRRYLCFAPRRTPWLALLDTLPAETAPLFGGRAMSGPTPHDLPRQLGGRVLASHCPGCLEPHHGAPRGLACFAHNDLKQLVWYYLCDPCGRLLERAGRRKRARAAERIEHNLERLGAFDRLKQGGMKA